jgi:CheY-like chemotaxis protein
MRCTPSVSKRSRKKASSPICTVCSSETVRSSRRANRALHGNDVSAPKCLIMPSVCSTIMHSRRRTRGRHRSLEASALWNLLVTTLGFRPDAVTFEFLAIFIALQGAARTGTELGYAVLEAADGVAGLKVLRSDARIDLVITDVGLPGGMNGRQMADAGRAIRPGLKTLFITRYAETAVVGGGSLEPGMQVLTKPFSIDALAGSVRELVKA